MGPSQGLLESILQGTIGHSIIAKDLEHRIVLWNEGARRAFGYEAEEVLGRHADLLHDASDVASGVVDQIHDEARREGQAVGTVLRRRKDGSVFRERIVVTRREEGGRHVGYVLVGRDVTQEVQARQDLEETKEMLEGILDHTGFFGIIALDDQGRVVHWNEGARRLFARDAPHGSSVEALFCDPSQDVHGAVEAATGEEVRLEGQRGKDCFPAAVSVAEHGTGRLLVVRDLTQQLHAEAARLREQTQRLELENRMVREADRAKGRFLANLSHELRTPLNSILGFSRLLQEETVGPLSAAQQELVGDVLRSATHLKHLIEELLDLTRLEAGTMQFHPEDVDVRAAMEEVRAALRREAEEKGLTLSLEGPAVHAHLDPTRLRQILYNLVGNAIKFTPRGHIRMRLAQDGRRLHIQVEDTGIGIRRSDLPRLFREFEQLDQGEAKRHQGTGLGLPLVKRLAEAQDGIVNVESEHGKGSTFTVTLPMRPRIKDARRAGRILLASDDDAERRELRDALPSAGFDAVEATNVDDAVTQVLRQPFDAVVVGLGLDEEDAQELIATLRYHGRRMPVIVVGQEEGHFVGVVAYLRRPLKSNELVRILRRTLEATDQN